MGGSSLARSFPCYGLFLGQNCLPDKTAKANPARKAELVAESRVCSRLLTEGAWLFMLCHRAQVACFTLFLGERG